MEYNLYKRWITLLYTWSFYNIINQPYWNKKKKYIDSWALDMMEHNLLLFKSGTYIVNF